MNEENKNQNNTEETLTDEVAKEEVVTEKIENTENVYSNSDNENSPNVYDTVEEAEKSVDETSIPPLNELPPYKPKKNKTIIWQIISAIAIIGLVISLVKLSSKNAEIEKLEEKHHNEIVDLNNEYNDLDNEYDELSEKYEEEVNGASKQLVDIKNKFESGDWQAVINMAKELHDKYNGSEEDKEAQKMVAESQKKIDEANAAKAAEEAQGYETGITYDQLARTPDDFEGKKVKFTGKVIQVIEDDDTTQIRLKVNDNSDTVLFGQYLSSITGHRVLEDDYITIYGESVGTISYDSTMGGKITIPGVVIDKIDQ